MENTKWIKIESEDDLPKEIIYNQFWVVNKSGFVSMNGYGRNRKNLWLNCYTHYQIIKVPEPPKT